MTLLTLLQDLLDDVVSVLSASEARGVLDGSHDDLVGDGLSLDVELLGEDVYDLVHDKAAVLVCGELEFLSVVLQDVLRKHLQEFVEIRALEDFKAFLDELVGNAIDIETTH